MERYALYRFFRQTTPMMTTRIIKTTPPADAPMYTSACTIKLNVIAVSNVCFIHINNNFVKLLLPTSKEIIRKKTPFSVIKIICFRCMTCFWNCNKWKLDLSFLLHVIFEKTMFFLKIARYYYYVSLTAFFIPCLFSKIHNVQLILNFTLFVC